MNTEKKRERSKKEMEFNFILKLSNNRKECELPSFIRLLILTLRLDVSDSDTQNRPFSAIFLSVGKIDPACCARFSARGQFVRNDRNNVVSHEYYRYLIKNALFHFLRSVPLQESNSPRLLISNFKQRSIGGCFYAPETFSSFLR